MNRQNIMRLGLLLAPWLFAAAGHAAETLEQRIARLEQKMDSQALVEMAVRLDRLERELQQLRGQTEEQAHSVKDLRQRQRDLYMDIDRRISSMEREAGAAGVATATEPAPASPVAPVSTPAAAAASTNAAPAPAAASGMDAEKERVAYQKAFDQLRDLRYAQAIDAFRSFLKEYPNGNYAPIAQYWIGEANYAQRNFKQAVADYQLLLQNYPKSPKLAEAMLKIGYSQYELGEKDAAKTILTDLANRYPDTTEAGQANAFLQKMRGESK